MRTRLLAGALGLALVGLAWQRGAFEPLSTALHQGHPTQPTVLFVVLDTVRADHLGVCGYDRPNTPVLRDLVERGATLHCDAHAAGSWTFPSHASLFTGLPVTRHGAHFAGSGEVIRKLTIRPLSTEYPTLAERFRERGYQTLGLSQNPVLAPASGLSRGFERWDIAPAFGTWYRERLLPPLRATLRDADPSRPLFLFVNIADAHDPWAGVPDGLSWVRAHDERVMYFHTDPQTGAIIPGDWGAYVTGTMPPDRAARFRATVTDLYDYALSQADANLGRVLSEVHAHGWDAAGLRLVVTADHGEFLGEHGLLRHGRYLWEGNQRVPVLVLDTAGPVSLPTPPVAGDLFSLVLDGHPLANPPPQTAAAFPDRAWMEASGGVVGGSTSAAVWTGTQKLLWTDGEAVLYDLSADPQELHPRPVGNHTARPILDALVDEVKASAARDFETDPQLIEALKAAGYVSE